MQLEDSTEGVFQWHCLFVAGGGFVSEVERCRANKVLIRQVHTCERLDQNSFVQALGRGRVCWKVLLPTEGSALALDDVLLLFFHKSQY